MRSLPQFGTSQRTFTVSQEAGTSCRISGNISLQGVGTDIVIYPHMTTVAGTYNFNFSIKYGRRPDGAAFTALASSSAFEVIIWF